MAKKSMPPGFRFHPTDVELIKYYLKRKVMGRKLKFEAIAEVDIYKYAPWDLQEKSCLRSGDLKLYFFCPRKKKYSNGARVNRATEFGFWKTTGKDRPVLYNNVVVGMIKTLVFHRGKAPLGDRTDWVMHEYRIDEPGLSERGVAQDSYVLCIVFKKDGPGPRNGAQYGAPFREQDWENDEDVDCVDVISSAVLPPPVVNQIRPVGESSVVPESQCIGKSDSCTSGTAPPTSKMLLPAPVIDDAVQVAAQDSDSDDILAMMAYFTEDDTLISNEYDQNKEHVNINGSNIDAPPCVDAVDIFKDLGDLGKLGRLGGGLYDFFAGNNGDYNPNVTILGDMPFIELDDLDAPLNSPPLADEPELIHINGLYTDQNFYNSVEFPFKGNPCFHQSPSILPRVPDQIEDQLAAFLSDNSIQGNANETP